MLKLTKRQINQKIVPHLSKGKRGPSCKVGLWRIVRAILYKLKTGAQWRELPLKSLFGRNTITWQSVFYYFSKWCKDGSFYRLWTIVLALNRQFLDMSRIRRFSYALQKRRSRGRLSRSQEVKNDQHAVFDRPSRYSLSL